MKKKIAIIGSGIAGLTLASLFQTNSNFEFVIYEKEESLNLNEGFGNLVVVEDHENPNTYQGGCLGFPQYGVCVNGRTGDFLAMDVHEWHCNTEFISNNNTDIWNFNRLSIILLSLLLTEPSSSPISIKLGICPKDSS